MATNSIRVKGLTGKIESTYMTDATPAAGTDAIQVEEHMWSEMEVNYLEENMRDNLAMAGMGRAGLTNPEGRFARLPVTVALKGSGSAYSATSDLELDVLMRCAGFAAAVDATPGTETITYTPRSDTFESATFYVYGAGMLHKLVGCRAALTALTFNPGQHIRATFDIMGVVLDDPADQAIPAFTYALKGVRPPTVKSAGLTLNSYDPSDFRTATLEMRTEIVSLPGGNYANGHGGFEIVDWDPHLRVSLDKPPTASFNPWALREAGTTFAWDVGPVGPAQYNRVTISGASGRVVGNPHAADGSLALVDLDIRLQNTDEETPDTALTIVFD
jgi:hypothetical protein